jgi:5-formyltetrahydrofolate cyclo-ligase
MRTKFKLNRISLKNQEYDREAPWNFCSERMSLAKRQDASENKEELRNVFLKRRKAISVERRGEAEKSLWELFQAKRKRGLILSFDSMESEISTQRINRLLLQEKSLVLPKVVNKELQLFRVTCDKQLVRSSWGIREPDPALCCKVSLEELAQIWVPSVALDEEGGRLGYGGGFYDRLLRGERTKAIGVAFWEQKSLSLPLDPWDIRLPQVFFF